MYATQWIIDTNIAVAIGTFSLAVVALVSILQVRKAQKSERKQKLLNEVIKWAKDIMVCGVERDIALLWDTHDRGFSVLSQMVNTFKYLLRTSTYIKSITLPPWDSLSKTIEETREQLDLQIKYIEEYIKKPSKDKFNITKNHRDEVNKLAVKIIKEGCTILTKNLD